MKIIRYALVMPRQLNNKWRNYKITEVSQIHILAFWITLTLASAVTLFCLVYNICRI